MNHWDEKFKSVEYIYGVEPNEWVRSVFNDEESLEIALLAEGEGRNAAYLADLGHQVTTYDYSKEGIEKTKLLAVSKGVDINTNLQDITVRDALPFENFDASVNIFGHVPKEGKEIMFSNLVNCVKPGGVIVFELYSKQQLEFKTGGPPNTDMLFSIDEIKGYLEKFSVDIIKLEEIITTRHEGKMHNGKSAVIQGEIRKR